MKTTDKLLDILKKSSSIENYIEDVSDVLLPDNTLAERLSDLLDSKNQKRSDIVRLSNLDRGYVYDIFAGKKRPSRDKLLAICFAMSLSIDEVQQLLKSTGYHFLYARKKRDSVILFALNRQISLMETNELLFQMEYDPLV